MQVRYGNNDHLLALDCIDHTVRKPLQAAAPGTGAQRVPSLGKVLNQAKRMNGLCQKLGA